ncbi:nuclear transport factor 2 family protein [Ramlibacter humi]|uniref:nuclear transport factor 2 family protein n=1 Tax=Ramlibacter humi TaxID=2530451 RepID=UPI001EF02A69|nr:nuclear transport factor 2 family protein [Ramlibacter humi]
MLLNVTAEFASRRAKQGPLLHPHDGPRAPRFLDSPPSMEGSRAMPVTCAVELQADWELEVLAAERRACAAFLAADEAELETLWAPGFVVNSPIGKVLPRPGVLAALRSGLIRHLSYDAHIESMSMFGHVVVVMGSDVVTDPPQGRATKRRFTNVWRFEAGQWRSIARHANAVPDAGRP